MVESLEPTQTWREKLARDPVKFFSIPGETNPITGPSLWSARKIEEWWNNRGNDESVLAETPTETSVAVRSAPAYSVDRFPSSSQIQGNAIGVGSDAYSQYLDERTDAWRLQEDAIRSQYASSLSQQQDAIDRQKLGMDRAMGAFGDFEEGMSALDTEIPYGAISELDTSRVTRQFDEAEGRLAEALNLARDDFSNQMVNEIRYFEDVTETMLADNIENTEQLHELSAFYSQALADEAYGAATLEGERAKLEIRAQFDRSIYEAQRDMERMKQDQKDATARAQEQFSIDYPEFDANREAITKATFFETMRDQGMSQEDAIQSWAGYENIWEDYSNQIATQADFNKFQRRELNDQTLILLDGNIQAQLQDLWEMNPDQLNPTDPNSALLAQQQLASFDVLDWLNRHDLAALFHDDNLTASREFLGMLRQSGISEERVTDFYRKGVEAAEMDNLVLYGSPESKAMRQAFQITNSVDDNWEDIYFNAMTIPVDSQHIYVDPSTNAIFPVAGPEVAFDQVGNVPTARGTPIVSTKKGTIMEIDYNHQDGHYIVILHDDGTKAKYSHMENASTFARGGTVLAGTSIGRVGNSGSASTDPYALYFTYWNANGTETDPSTLFPNYGSV